MKNRILIFFVATALLLPAFLEPPRVNAQNPQPTKPQYPVQNSSQPPTLPAGMDPSGPIGQVVRMIQAGAAENAVLNYITQSSVPFPLSAADETYLNDLGTPSGIQSAMVQRNKELGLSADLLSPQPAPSDQTQEPEDVTEDYFYDALEPYGTWLNISGDGLCWQPCAAGYDANWTPYGTFGQWIYTDAGWYWLSGYSWGWCVFHYGRWFHDAQHGWCWWPSTTWGPSWVVWRYWGSYCGWAPLPPHSYYGQENGVAYAGLVYNHAPVASDYNFGLGANLFDFVPMTKLFDANTEHFRLQPAQAGQVFARSKVLNRMNSNDGIIVNDGIPVTKFAAVAGGAVRSFTIRAAKSVALPGARGEQILPDGKTLAINRPYFDANVPSDLKQGIWPIAASEQPVAHQEPTIIVNENPDSYSPAGDQNNSVIYMDSAAQNAPPVPTVTTDGPQDYPANAVGAGAPAQNSQSYWTGFAGAAAPVYNSSLYMSPRLQSHERWNRKVQPPANHRDVNPPRSPPGARGTPSPSHASGVTAPAHDSNQNGRRQN